MEYDGAEILYILLIITIGLSLLASLRVRLVYNRYSKVPSQSGMSGADAAYTIMRNAGIFDVAIVEEPGKLTDHYNPSTKTLHLSTQVFYGKNVAAIGVASHEAGHAIQHYQGYTPLILRSKLVPAANFGSKYGFIVVFLGILLGRFSSNTSELSFLIMDVGILLYSVAVLFQLVTLPVEFNASRRAVALTSSLEILSPKEKIGCKSVLFAAALTYIAAAAASAIQLLRLLFIRGRRR